MQMDPFTFFLMTWLCVIFLMFLLPEMVKDVIRGWKRRKWRRLGAMSSMSTAYSKATFDFIAKTNGISKRAYARYLIQTKKADEEDRVRQAAREKKEKKEKEEEGT